MGIKRQTARVSISVLMMVLEDFSSIHSYVPMAQSLISSTSSVIGGSMLTAHWYIDFFLKISNIQNTFQAEDFYYLNEEVAAAAVAASAAQNLVNGEAISFPSQLSQGTGVVPGQAFGIQPRIGKRNEEERSGNQLSDVLSLADNFPVDRIPIQFKGLLQS